MNAEVTSSLSICPCRLLPNKLANKLPNKLTNAKASYAHCCAPFHDGCRQADSAEILMRSRYSAFVLVVSDYIVATTLPWQQKLLDKQAITDWAIQTDWVGLEIVNELPKVGKRHAQIEFKAYYNSDVQRSRSAHHELSTFVRAKGVDHKERWYFLDPTVYINMTQKQPCICGSGDKFKRCCGRFL